MMINPSYQNTDDDDRDGELSDSDLEQVVGGLSRVWHVDGPAMLDPAPVSFSVTALPSLDVARRVSA